MTDPIKVTSLRQLDTLVAERVMGWEFRGTTGFLGSYPQNIEGRTVMSPVPAPVPRYTTDANAMMEVIEHLASKEPYADLGGACR